MTRISRITAWLTRDYHEHGKVLRRAVAFDVRVRFGVVQWEAEVSEDTDEQIEREADEVLFGEHFVHPAQRGSVEFFEALQQVNLRGEAEDEDRESDETASGQEGVQVLEVEEVVAHVVVERVDDGDRHDVQQRQEAQE